MALLSFQQGMGEDDCVEHDGRYREKLNEPIRFKIVRQNNFKSLITAVLLPPVTSETNDRPAFQHPRRSFFQKSSHKYPQRRLD